MVSDYFLLLCLRILPLSYLIIFLMFQRYFYCFYLSYFIYCLRNFETKYELNK